ncbi:sodium:glutamate symporter [Oceanobacillus kimchii]|uniref:Sodium:glutamate symporter n=1 Tax=Oceanobacillus kimchii TaxID=746691 RepID=A0ABQ5TFF6_9BACI|nr:sodium:glutamate symporter [Oceanobacillus kimchii]MCT1578928.1 sodium:glutamate symporter [Oceanobacillus kimchii]MCT2137853.1 sodium:glutamate symporter [Oceanobacillus kimchii]GLO65180.1 sodium:glutamate symporter [Oceanobacillus kimchii]
MENFTIWSLMIDISIISGLLLVGTILRAKVRWIQSLFLPASMIAGFLGLAFGPSGLGILPFSEQFSVYPSLLIAVIFAAIPIGAAKVRLSEVFHRVRNMFSYSMILTLSMWGIGVLFAMLILNPIFNDLPNGFGLILGAGFLGGHGTAAALGEGLIHAGWEEAMDLGMTSATVGLLVAVLGGLFLIKHSTESGKTQFITSFKDLPSELKSGLMPKSKRFNMGQETVSSSSIDPLVLHLAIIAFIIGISYWLTNTLSDLIPAISIPLFSVAFILGLLFQAISRRIKSDKYVDGRVMERIGGTATDFLVAFGIASINITVVMDYALPLILLFAFGTLWAYLLFRFVGPNIFKEFWLEKSIFGWGWSTGTVAMGLALLRIVDPELKSRTPEDYALAYVGVAPIDIIIVTFAPILFALGFTWAIPVVLLLGAAAIIVIYKVTGLWGQGKHENTSN